MFKKFKKWYNHLPPLKQLAIIFISNWLSYLFSSLLGDKVFFDEPHTWNYHIFHATWMASTMTVFFSWTKVKSLFKRENNTTEHVPY